MSMFGMSISQLKTRVEIEKRTVVKGASGGKNTTWDARAKAWARKRDLGGNVVPDTAAAGGQVPEARTEFVLAYRPWLQADSMRIKVGATTYEIKHVAHWDNQWTVATCRTGVNNG